MRKIELGLGWLRAVAQGYNYSCIRIELGINIQTNLNGLWVKLSWGLDGCARRRKVTVTIAIAIKLSCGVICKGI